MKRRVFDGKDFVTIMKDDPVRLALPTEEKVLKRFCSEEEKKRHMQLLEQRRLQRGAASRGDLHYLIHCDLR